jgi:hypothetical protein
MEAGTVNTSTVASYASVDDARISPAVLHAIPTDPSILAEMYISGDDQPVSDELKDAFRLWIFREFHNHKLGDVLEITSEDVSPELMLANWHSKGVLLVSDAHSEHPFLSVADNVRFRAVHDWHHISLNAGFCMAGELATFKQALMTAPKSIWWILFSEIVLQAAACIHTGEFQPQKIVRTGIF